MDFWVGLMTSQYLDGPLLVSDVCCRHVNRPAFFTNEKCFSNAWALGSLRHSDTPLIVNSHFEFGTHLYSWALEDSKTYSHSDTLE